MHGSVFHEMIIYGLAKCGKKNKVPKGEADKRITTCAELYYLIYSNKKCIEHSTLLLRVLPKRLFIE